MTLIKTTLGIMGYIATLIRTHFSVKSNMHLLSVVEENVVLLSVVMQSVVSLIVVVSSIVIHSVVEAECTKRLIIT